MKRSDILRTLADDPEAQFQLKLFFEWKDISHTELLRRLADFPHIPAFSEIRLKPKLHRVYGWSTASGCVLFQTRNDSDTHYADLDERGCGEIKEIEK